MRSLALYPSPRDKEHPKISQSKPPPKPPHQSSTPNSSRVPNSSPSPLGQTSGVKKNVGAQVHQRVPTFLGSAEDVTEVSSYIRYRLSPDMWI